MRNPALLVGFAVTLIVLAPSAAQGARKGGAGYPGVAMAHASEPLNLSQDSSSSEMPSVGVDSNGSVHVVWNDDNQGDSRVLYPALGWEGVVPC